MADVTFTPVAGDPWNGGAVDVPPSGAPSRTISLQPVDDYGRTIDEATNYHPALAAAGAVASSAVSGHAADDLRGWIASNYPGGAGALRSAALTPAMLGAQATDSLSDAARYAAGGYAGLDATDPASVAAAVPHVVNAVGLMGGAGLPMAEDGAVGALGGKLGSVDAALPERLQAETFAPLGDHVVRRSSDGDLLTYSLHQKEGGGYNLGPDSLGELMGEVTLEPRTGNRLEVQMSSVEPYYRRQGLASDLYDHIQYDSGVTMQPSGTLLPDGYAFWQNRDPAAVQYHREIGNAFFSPRQLQERSDLQAAAGKTGTPFQNAFAALPPEAKTPEALATMFARGAPLPGAAPTLPSALQAPPSTTPLFDTLFAQGRAT